jgi:hypothetical protein
MDNLVFSSQRSVWDCAGGKTEGTLPDYRDRLHLKIALWENTEKICSNGSKTRYRALRSDILVMWLWNH